MLLPQGFFFAYMIKLKTRAWRVFDGCFVLISKDGGAEETRTPHLSNANAALYQMSYCPVNRIIAHGAGNGKGEGGQPLHNSRADW